MATALLVVAIVFVVCAPLSSKQVYSEGVRLVQDGRWAEAFGPLMRALALYRGAQDHAGEGRALYFLGAADMWGNRRESARDAFTQALPLLQAAGLRDEEGFVWLGLGRLYLVRFDQYEAARSALSRAQARFHDAGDDHGEARALGNLGLLYYTLGQYAAARDAWIDSLVISRRAHGPRPVEIPPSDPGAEASDLWWLAVVYDDLGDARQALAINQEALKVAQDTKDVERQARVLQRIGKNYRDLAEYDQAFGPLKEAQRLFLSLHNTLGQAQALQQIGELYYELHDFAAARRSLEQARGLWRQVKTPDALGGTWLVETVGAQISEDLGATLLAVQQYRDALLAETQAEEVRQHAGDPRRWAAAYYRGRALEGLRRDAEAEQAYRASVAAIEGLRQSVDLPEHRVGFFSDKVEVYDRLSRLLIRRAERGDTRAAAAAFHVAEQGRARGMLDLIGEARRRAAGGIDTRLVGREKELRAELNAVQEQWRLEMAKPPTQRDQSRVRVLTERRLELETALGRLRVRVVPKSPLYTEPSWDAATVEHALRPGEVLLEYFLTDDLAAVWVLRSGRPLQLRLLPEAGSAIDQLAGRLAEGLRTPPATAAVISEGFDAGLAHRLYLDLVQPVASDLQGAQTIFVVPHGSLLTVPFEALVQSVSSGSQRPTHSSLPRSSEYPSAGTPRYFGDNYALAHLPSASLLVALRQTRYGSTAGPRKPIVIFADPVYGRDEPGATGLPENVGAEELQAALRGPVTGLRGAQFTRLPFTGIEAREIGSFFGAGPAANGKSGDLYLREQAQETVVKRLSDRGELLKYRYVHFATHGVLGNEVRGRWLEPALVLSLLGDQENDGFLQMSEVLNLRLNADLVVLSACQTGLGEEVRGEGLVGLTRAVMYAGTPTVVVSLWSVSDPATAKLMVEFYRGLNRGLAKGEALRRAKQSLRTQGYRDARGQSGSGASPYFWAPFIMVGDLN